MSGINFPTNSDNPDSHSNHRNSTHQEDFFGSSYNPSSSFQVNPLSHHPPRTPRTSDLSSSALSGSYVYGSEIYHSSISNSSNGDNQSVAGGSEKTELREVLSEKRPAAVEQFEEEDMRDDEVEHVKEEQASKVTAPEIWREMLKTSSGRDKAFKIMQYSIKVYLLFHSAMSSSVLFAERKKTPWELGLVQRLEAAGSGLSTTRKALIMFNWLTPLTSILASQHEDMDFTSRPKGKKQEKPLVHLFLRAPPPVLLDFVNGLSDDIYAWYRLGLIGKKTGERAGRFSDWCWFAATLIALVELGFERTVTAQKIQAAEARLYADSVTASSGSSKSSIAMQIEKEMKKLRRQDFWLKIQRTKLLMDLLFVTYDLFNIKYAPKTVKAFAGLSAALLSSAKLFNGHRTALLLKQSRS